MEEKINISGLVSRLSLRTGDTKKESEDFIREFVSLVISRLEAGDSVRIRDIGVFKCVEVGKRKSVDVTTGKDVTISAHRKVSFIPAKELAEKVNEPFEMFQTVEIDDAVAERLAESSIVERPEDIAAPGPVVEEPVVETAAENIAIETAAGETPEEPEAEYTLTEPETSAENEDPEAPEMEIVSGEAPEAAEEQIAPEGPDELDERDIAPEAESCAAEDNDPIYQGVRDEDDYGAEEVDTIRGMKKRTRRSYWLGVGTGVVVTLLLVLAAWNIYGIRILRENEAAQENATMSAVSEVAPPAPPAPERMETGVSEAPPVESPQAEAPKAEEPKAETVATEPSDKKVYDTITTSRYLTTMAKSHYGNYHLWPYIYKENAAFLGHPDRIKPGTRVVIPPLSKYGVDPKNPKDIEKAKKLGVEIYSRYQ